jgi:NtrC-family two-component system response regulator AlgB
MANDVATVMIARPNAANPTGPELHCLVVDDEANIRTTLGLCLETLGHEVREASSSEDAMQALADGRFDVAFVDIRLGTSSGLDLMTRLLAHSPRLKVIVITAYASVNLAVQAMGRGAIDFLCKPFTPEQVTAAVSRIAELQALEHNVGTLQDRTGTAGPEADFATASAAVQHAVTVARQAAPSQTPILIIGEVGTGMRVLGRAIHGWSNRSDGPFRSINCTQRSPAYVDLALFGQSFVGDQPAQADRPSLIDEAEGGTLVVGHVEALSSHSQARLLRLIEKREYEVPGTFTVRACDVRVVATAAPSLEESGGPINADLLIALQRVSVALPPLRQRADDIPMLAQRYLAYVRQISGKTVLGFGADALELLRTYAWPGNLHELRDVVAKAVAQCNGPYVEPHHLPAVVRAVAGTVKGQLRIGDRVSLREMEEQHIRAILATAKSLQEAADILGIDPQALYRRRKQFGI